MCRKNCKWDVWVAKHPSGGGQLPHPLSQCRYVPGKGRLHERHLNLSDVCETGRKLQLVYQRQQTAMQRNKTAYSLYSFCAIFRCRWCQKACGNSSRTRRSSRTSCANCSGGSIRKQRYFCANAESTLGQDHYFILLNYYYYFTDARGHR